MKRIFTGRTAFGLLLLVVLLAAAGLVRISVEGRPPQRSLSACIVNDRDLAGLAIDMFVKGINRRSSYLLRTSAAGPLADTVEMLLSSTPPATRLAHIASDDLDRTVGSVARIGFQFEQLQENLNQEEYRARGRLTVAIDEEHILDTIATLTVAKIGRSWKVVAAPSVITCLR